MKIIALSLALAALPVLAVPAAAQETRASAAAKAAREFTQSDSNKDGVLTRAEVQARISRMNAGSRKLDPVHAKRLTNLWFDRADADKNGKVTQAESAALLAAVFARYDANGDGKIGGDERAAAAAGAKRGR